MLRRLVCDTSPPPDARHLERKYPMSGRCLLGSGKPDRRVAGAGTPVRPEHNDYRRAGVEAMHFPKLVERWVQHLRRCAGFLVQYFGAIEAQCRLVPHIHLTIRGAIPREVIRAATAATYVQLWWPCFDDDRIVYDEQTQAEDLPRWDADLAGYADPVTGVVLTTWEEALRGWVTDRRPRAERTAEGRAVDMATGTNVTARTIAPLPKRVASVRGARCSPGKRSVATGTPIKGDCVPRHGGQIVQRASDTLVQASPLRGSWFVERRRLPSSPSRPLSETRREGNTPIGAPACCIRTVGGSICHPEVSRRREVSAADALIGPTRGARAHLANGCLWCGASSSSTTPGSAAPEADQAC